MKKLYALASLFVVTFLNIYSYAADNISGDSLGKILCLEYDEADKILYAGGEMGVNYSEDIGRTWKEIKLPANIRDVTGIAVKDGKRYICSSSGIFCTNIDNEWTPVLGIKGLSGMSEGPGLAIVAWRGEDLFAITDADAVKLHFEGVRGLIEDVAVSGNRIYLVSDGYLHSYSSVERLLGKELTRELLVREVFLDEDLEAPEEKKTGQSIYSGPLRSKISLNENGGLVIVSGEGVFRADETGSLNEYISTKSILDGAEITGVLYSGRYIIITCNRAVFVYSANDNLWKKVLNSEPDKDIYGAIMVNIQGGEGLLLVYGEALLRSIPMEEITALFREGQEAHAAMRESGTIPISEVQSLAIKYAEVSPKKIDRWRRGAKWKAIMPKVSVGFSQSFNDNIEIYKSASTSYIIEAPYETDIDWNVGLTWDLSDIIWNDAQTNIDVRSRLMVQMRNDILEDVTRLYFERERSISELRAMRKEGAKETKLEQKRLRVKELTGYIDALTGGNFSEKLTLKSQTE